MTTDVSKILGALQSVFEKFTYSRNRAFPILLDGVNYAHRVLITTNDESRHGDGVSAWCPVSVRTRLS